MSELVLVLHHVPLFVLLLVRAGGLMLVAPILAHAALPILARIAFSVLLALILLPLSLGEPFAAPAGIIGYLPLLVTEAGIGLTLGFAAGVALAALRAAGELIGHQIGMAMAQVAAPDFEGQSTPPGTLFALMGLLFFLGINGHHWLIRGLTLSCRMAPPGACRWSPRIAEILGGQFAGLFAFAVRLAAPVMAIMFLTTVLIALLAKAVPQINLMIVGYPVKVFIGLTVLATTFPLLFPVVGDAFQQLQVDLANLVRAF